MEGPLAAFPRSPRRSPARAGTVTAFSACDEGRTRVRKVVERVLAPENAGGVRSINPRTSVARNPWTADAGDTRASDAAKLSGPSPRESPRGLASPDVASTPQNRNLMSSSTASPAKTSRRALREAGGPQGELALRDLHPRFDREWIGAGVQLARQPTRSVGSLYQKPSPRSLAAWCD
jgi:hypothetical protein